MFFKINKKAEANLFQLALLLTFVSWPFAIIFHNKTNLVFIFAVKKKCSFHPVEREQRNSEKSNISQSLFCNFQLNFLNVIMVKEHPTSDL